MKRLSIILPIYNVEPYIERCLRSLEDQDIPKTDYEIICINDGSPDNSRDIVLKMQKEYDNIILIDQENQGVSRARNNGIDKAKGRYLFMVDPDDYVKPNSLKNKLNILDEYDLDIGFTGYIILNETLKEEYRYDPVLGQNQLLTGIDFTNSYQKGKSEIRDPHRSWAVFFKTSFINSNNLRYLADVPYLEDGEFMARVTCLAKRVLFINNPFYLRTTRQGSATHSKLYYTEIARNGFLKAANNLLLFRDNYCTNEKQKVFMNQPIVHFTILCITSLPESQYFKLYPKLFNSLKRGELRILETQGCSRFYTKMATYYNLSIHIFYMNWMIIKIIKSIQIRVKKIACN